MFRDISMNAEKLINVLVTLPIFRALVAGRRMEWFGFHDSFRRYVMIPIDLVIEDGVARIVRAMSSRFNDVVYHALLCSSM